MKQPDLKATYRVIPFMHHSGKAQNIVMESKSVVVRGLGIGECLQMGRTKECLEARQLFSILFMVDYGDSYLHLLELTDSYPNKVNFTGGKL